MRTRMAILGAGVSGLTLGRILAAEGYDTTLFEKEARIGGAVRSVTIDGFTYDITGVHVMYSKDAPILDLMLRLLDLDTVKTHRQTKIFFRGRYVRYPFENGIGELGPKDRLACLKGYVEAHFQRRYEATEPPRNLLDWIYWRFGDGIANAFMVPYNERMWKTDLSTLSSEWVVGRVPDAPLEDVLKSAIGIPTDGYTHQATFYYPRTGGFQSIADSLARPIEDRVRLSTPVSRVEKLDGVWSVDGEEFDQVVSTVPLPALTRIFTVTPEAIRSAADGIEFLSMATFLIGMEGEETTNHSWVYLPHSENGRVHRVTHLTNHTRDASPPGKHCILGEMTYRGDLQLSEEDALGVVEELDACGIVEASKVTTLHWSQSEYAYMVQDLEFKRNRRRTLDYFRSQGLITLGRFGRCEYLNVDMCLRKAITLAESLLGRTISPSELV